MTSLLKVEGLKKSFGGVAPCGTPASNLKPARFTPCVAEMGGQIDVSFDSHGDLSARLRKNLAKRQEVEYSSPAEALASGIAIIEQELSPIPQMTVAENIFLGREPPGRFGGVELPQDERGGAEDPR